MHADDREFIQKAIRLDGDVGKIASIALFAIDENEKLRSELARIVDDRDAMVKYKDGYFQMRVKISEAMSHLGISENAGSERFSGSSKELKEHILEVHREHMENAWKVLNDVLTRKENNAEARFERKREGE